MKALLLEKINPSGIALLRKKGFTVEAHDRAFSQDELREAIKGVSLLGIRSRTNVTPKVLENADELLAIGAYCIGTNQIDLEATARAGIAAFNAPYSNTRSVAELAIGEIIVLIRKLYNKIEMAHRGEWDKASAGCYEVRGKKLGIIGYGNIGTQVSLLAESLGMQVYYYDVVDKLSIGNAIKMDTLEDVLEIADVVTIHVDGRKENTDLIGDAQFTMMKDGVLFLNLSRGHIVDIDALRKHILSGKIAGAGVDVFPQEPRGADEKFISPLQGLPNVLLTPHIGGSTEEAQRNIGDFVSSKLVEYLETGSTFTSVNFPRIQLQPLANTHRLLHIHNNVPGVLSKLNTIFGNNQVNVVAQYLSTTQTIGYVIADVDAQYKASLFDDLSKVDNTIKVRILY